MRKGDFVTYDGHTYYRTTVNGYYALYDVVDGNPAYDKSYVLEHRLLYEIYHGVKLGPSDSVHHKNHNRSDNSIENLVLLSSSEHSRLHAFERSGAVPEGYAYRGYMSGNPTVMHNYRMCPDCGKPISRGAKRCTGCSRKAARSSMYPSKEQLTEYIKTMSNIEIAQMCGVSDRAVAKWRRNYGLPSASAQRGWSKPAK